MIPMSDAWISVIVAVITGLLSLAGVYFSNRKSAAIMEYRMKELEKRWTSTTR